MSEITEVSLTNSSTQATANIRWWLPFLVCGLAASFYLYEYALQVAPSVMTNELMRDLNVDAAGLGSMSAFYFYAYAPLQIPAGMMFDRYGPRVLIALALLVCAVGASFFALTHSVAMASLGRFLIGAGSTFSFVGTLILIARWFPPHYFATLSGVVQLMASVGALGGEVPLAAAADAFGWRNATLFCAAIGVVLALAVWLIVRDYPPVVKPIPIAKVKESVWHKLRVVVSMPQMWFIGTYNFMIWAPIAVFAALWGVPYFKEYYHTSATVASGLVSVVWIGVGLGSPYIGWLSDKIKRRNLPLTLFGLLGVLSLTAALLLDNIPMFWMYVLMFFVGLGASGQILTFAVVKEISLPEDVGTACGFVNMATVLNGAILLPLVGYILRFTWSGQVVDSIPIYTIHAYQHALLILPVCFLIAVIMSMFFIKETNCKAQV